MIDECEDYPSRCALSRRRSAKEAHPSRWPSITHSPTPHNLFYLRQRPRPRYTTPTAANPASNAPYSFTRSLPTHATLRAVLHFFLLFRIQLSTLLHTSINLYGCFYVCTCTDRGIYVRMCMYLCTIMYVCMYICMYVIVNAY
jgi:hypothetical protein